MTFTRRRATLGQTAAAVAIGALAATLAPQSAEAQNLRMSSLGPASPTTVFSITLSQVLKREHGYQVQLATGSPATRQAVEAANQQVDLFVTAV